MNTSCSDHYEHPDIVNDGNDCYQRRRNIKRDRYDSPTFFVEPTLKFRR